LAIASVADKLIIGGGTNYTNRFASVDVFDPSLAPTFWGTGFSLSTAIAFHAGASVNNTVGILAGGDSPAFSNIAFLVEEVFIPPTTDTTPTETTEATSEPPTSSESSAPATSESESETEQTSEPETTDEESSSKSFIEANLLYIIIAAAALLLIIFTGIIVGLCSGKRKRRKDQDIYF
jgi:hypothetical protein